MDVNFSVAKPEDSIDLRAWESCTKRVVGDHDVVLVIQRVMDVFLKYQNSLKENRASPLKEEDLLEYTEQLHRVNVRIHSVLLNDEANPQRGLALSTKYNYQMYQRKHAYETFEDEDPDKKKAGLDYLPTVIARTKMAAFEKSSADEWSSGLLKPKQPPLSSDTPLSGYHPKDVQLSKSVAKQWTTDYKRRRASSNDPIEINALDLQMKDLQNRSHGKSPSTSKALPPSSAVPCGGAFAPPSQYGSQTRYNHQNGFRQVDPPAGSKGHPNGEAWTDDGRKIHPSANLCKQHNVAHMRISWPTLDNLSRSSDRLMAIVSHIKPKDADCKEMSNEQGNDCKIERVPQELNRDNVPRFDWAPRTCKGCFFRRRAPPGSPEEDVGHANNYIYGNGNGQ